MTERFEVRTPLGADLVDSPDDVRDVIDAYMKLEDATLAEVTVIALPEFRTGITEAVEPGAFWP